jgi:hypothetical protein
VDFVGGKNGTKVTQNVSLTAGPIGYDLIGLEASHSFRTHGSGSFNEKYNYGGYFIVPLFEGGGNTSNGVKRQVNSQRSLRSGKTKGLPTIKTGGSGGFYGGNIGVGAALGLGVDLNLKIGFKKKK